MKDIKQKVWLTSALTNKDVGKALTLAFSLRRVLTCYKLAVIVSSKVSSGLREALNTVFDFVFALEEDRNTTGLKNEEFVMVFALTLKGFDSCVMLSPNMMAVKNCDELLQGDGQHQFSWKGDDHDEFLPILKFRPSIPVFKNLSEQLKQRNGHNLRHYLKKWVGNEERKYVIQNNKCNRILNLKIGMLLGNEEDISIANLICEPNQADIKFETYGLIGQRIMELWKIIQNENVSPILEQKMDLNSLEVMTVPHQNHDYIGDAIAIIGMSCRYAGANSLEEFWDILINGKDATGNPPDFRWLREQSSTLTNAEHRKTNAGFLKCSVDDFDAKFFGISPKELLCMDPQHRLLHELVWEGLEDAAIDPVSLEGTKGGVFIGSWTNEYKDILSHGGHDEFYRMYMGNSIGAGAARISHLLGMTGPSIATESGCSSAMVAVHLACKSLERRESNFALACGVNLLLNPFDKEIMPMVVSPDGKSRTFDANANGFARGEGCGVLVLKRLSDAVRDGYNIWGLIRGSGMTQEGVSKSMGTPTVHCESLAMKEALESGGVDPALVSYVEAHGTGTTVGDPMEVAAIAKAYHSKQRKDPLLIGSVKTNVGHTESCSGITGIMKVILAMQHEIIPPHRNFETLNPAIDLEAVPAKIPLEPVQWPKNHQGSPRFAGVSSFGITGTDAHVILQEAPTHLPNSPLKRNKYLERPLHIMKISGKTDEALDILLESYRNKFNECESDFRDLAYTSNIGRADFSQRAILIAKSKEDAVKRLEQNKIIRGEESSESLGKICFLFTGQGSQYPGMAKQLYETSPIFRIHFEYCEKILKDSYNIDIKQVLWLSAPNSNEISRTLYSQTSIFCVEYALLKLWESWGVKPDYALGHSLGEFAAAVCAGILNVEDALKLVAERSLLIDQLPRGKMLVIKADKQRVDAIMNKFAENDQNMMLDYAALNSSDQTVVAGDSEVVFQFSERCKLNNLKCIMLDSTHAFHSKHMDPMLNQYGRVANITKNLGGNENCKFISGMKGTEIESAHVNAQYWVEHTREKVLFMEASKKAVGLGCKTFIEIGPSPVLTALTMMNNDDGQLTCLASLKKNEDEWETLLTTLGKLYVKGLKIDWKGLEQFCERRKVRLPHYPFIGKTFWPEMIGMSGTTIHPLVGSPLSNASSSRIFENGLNLRSEEYINDHSIGDHVIFPGAGYLEMCLAAGLATIEGTTSSLPTPSRPMKVENLSIEAPLLLQEGKTCQVQTVVEYNTSLDNEEDWNDLNIKIFHRLEGETNTTKWLSHAQATFSPLPSTEEKNVSFDPSLFVQTLEKPSDDGILTQLYDKLASVGLKFGPTFRSIEKLWRDEGSQTLLAKVKVPSSEEQSSSSQYILHPVVLDAMIQAVMILRHTFNIKKKLYVPIKIGKFVWLSGGTDTSSSSSSTPELYIHAFSSSSEANNNPIDSALLLDSSGTPLALMSSVEFIDTTVKAIESVLQQQTCSLPEMWENVWRKTENPAEHSLDLSNFAGRFYTEEFAKRIETEYNIPPLSLEQTFNEMSELVYLNILRAFHELGWKPVLHSEFKESDLIAELKIEQQFKKYFGFLLQVLSSDGLVEKVIEGTWKVTKILPNITDILSTLHLPAFTSDLVAKFKSTLLYSKFGENLAGILRGRQSALGILFPEENTEWPSVADFYPEYGKVFRISEFSNIVGAKRLFRVKEAIKAGGGKKVLKILEVGAGTGSYTLGFLKELELLNITDFEYTYTDISAAFFTAAQKRFEKYSKNMIYKKLDIEQDPIEQGFTPEYYDYIYMAEVIHATRDIKESLRNLRMLMKPWAKLDMIEQTKVHRFITFLFGPLEGFWRFQDLELRPNHCTLSRDSWERVFKENGFGIDGTLSILNNYHSLVCVHKTPDEICRLPQESVKKVWLLFHCESSPVSSFLQKKIGGVQGRKVLRVMEGSGGFGESGNSFEINRESEQDYSTLFRSIQRKGLTVEGILYCWGLDEKRVTQEEILLPYFYMTKAFLTLKLRVQPRVIALTRATIPVKDNEISHFHSSTLWAFTKSLQNEHEEINCRAVEVAEGPLDELKLEAIFHEIWNCDKEVQVAYHGTSRYVPRMQPHNPKNNDLDLPKGTDKFQLILPETKAISDLSFGSLELGLLGEDQVEVQMKASALNFRDVLSVIKPTEQFKDSNAVGFDFAGVVKRVGGNVSKWKPGDQVIGCNIENKALPSHARLDQGLLVSLPDNMTLCEAATIPAVYITSAICLIETAKIKKEDVVLLHTATGGVGLSAIEICKHVGCTIIATAGSKRKQNYLRELGIQHIFHSRNTQYGDDILKVTNGRGVDVVLNSLTSEGFKEATLKACAKNARFIEMSKLNIWKREQVKELRPDVDYTIVDVSSADANEWNRFMLVIRDLMDKGVVKPIPYVRFDGLNIREALQYMQKAKHIGKIVCVMPEIGSKDGEIKVHTPIFNERSSYLITGGLGGIGFEVCKWMIEMGGKHVILAGRSPPNSSMQAKINELNSKGANVIPVQLDVGNFEECKDLIQNKMEETLNLPPLRGIMHAAGVINDAIIENQNWAKLSSTFGTKIKGSLNLHDLTKNLNLEHFITFSSSAALFGPAAQCNHAAANMFEDSFIHYRNSIGLPGMTVNWGQWGEVGVATEVDIPGLKTISNVQGINGLQYAMKSHFPQLAMVNFDSFVMFSKLVPYLSTYLDERVWKKNVKTSVVGIKSDKFWEQYDAKADLEGKTALLKEQIRGIIRSTLKLDEIDAVDDEGNLVEMGVDSLMFVEIKNSLQMLMGDRLTISMSLLKDCNNVNMVTESLARMLQGDGDQLPEKPTADQVSQLIREDSLLPQHITSKPEQKAGSVGDIRKVLLTGCTGTLGPYLLRRLTATPQISQVVCLMRPSSKLAPEQRLQNLLQKKGLLSQINMEKIRCVTGNVALTQLGLEEGVWAELIESVDAIVHSAAHVDHTTFYVEKESKTNYDTRAVNIGGTINIFEFACEGKLKHVCLEGSLISAVQVDGEGILLESWPQVEDFDGVTSFAYPISKFVGDVLAGQANERGIPTKLFRLPVLTGDSQTGACPVENNHVMMRYLFILKNKIMPDNPFPMQMLPVDISADVSIRLFLDEEAALGLYNITHLNPDIDQQFVNVATKFGVNIELVELPEFVHSMKAVDDDGSSQDRTMTQFEGFYEDAEDLLAQFASAPVLQKWIEGNEQVWLSRKVRSILPNFYEEQRPTMEYIYNGLIFAKAQGWFKKIGLEETS